MMIHFIAYQVACTTVCSVILMTNDDRTSCDSSCCSSFALSIVVVVVVVGWHHDDRVEPTAGVTYHGTGMKKPCALRSEAITRCDGGVRAHCECPRVHEQFESAIEIESSLSNPNPTRCRTLSISSATKEKPACFTMKPPRTGDQ
jgi:hypothetical protein